MKSLKIAVMLLGHMAAICFSQQGYIPNVPDYSQPPSTTLPSTVDPTNYCAPFSFLNIIQYWDSVQSHPGACEVIGGMSVKEAAEYIGWCMDTNDQGSTIRKNGNPNYPYFTSTLGTYAVDQWKGGLEFISLSPSNPINFPYSIPVHKKGYSWLMWPDSTADFGKYMLEIDEGYPVKLDFLFWNIEPTGNVITGTEFTEDTIYIYKWREIINNSGFDTEAPLEEWNLMDGQYSIGHAVTGVGYFVDTVEFAIVHDNWKNTPKSIAIPWRYVIYMLSIRVPEISFIENVPDYSQPSTSLLPSTKDSSNYCAPFSFLNILEYWEIERSHPNAKGIMGGLPAKQVAEYIGWFMDTNDQGSSDRVNGNQNYSNYPSANGTYSIDEAKGISEYVTFDTTNIYSFPYFIPSQKKGYPWDIIPYFSGSFSLYKAEIDSGYPAKLDFLYWHVLPTGNFILNPENVQDTIYIYQWGSLLSNSGYDPDAPEEEWNMESGEGTIPHAVTGVGYIIDTLEYAIVHDNWSSTPENIAVPWQNSNQSIQNVNAMMFVHVPDSIPVSLNYNNNVLYTYRICQNYPNPFNPCTTIEFFLPHICEVSLKIFNIQGVEVTTVVSERLEAGKHQYKWNALQLANGIYFYRLKTNEFVETKKMILIR